VLLRQMRVRSTLPGYYFNLEGHLRPCAYWARKLKDAETRYSAYDKEAWVIMEVISRV